MKKYSLEGGSSFLEKFFPFWSVVDDEIQAAEKERIAAAAVSAQNIDNNTDTDDEAESSNSASSGTSNSGGGTGTVNIGSINIGGDVHLHMDNRRSDGTRSSRHSSNDDDVIDVDFVDIADHKPPQAQAPTTRQRLTQSKSLSRKQELTKDIRMGDFDALAELDQMIESRDVEKLIELFQDNKPLCLWIKRQSQQNRWNQLPAIVKELVNQQ